MWFLGLKVPGCYGGNVSEHLIQMIDILLVLCLSIKVSDGVQEQLCYSGALWPRQACSYVKGI